MKFILILSFGLLMSSAVQAKVVSSSLADGLDSDTPLDARLLPNRLTSVLATKTPLALASTQKGTVSKAYTIAPAFPTLTTTWYNTPRNYWVYTPYGYQADSNPNLLLVLDGHRLNKELALAQTLDHLIESKQIPPTLMILLHTGRGQGRDGDDRRYELMRTNSEWADYVVQHLFPDLRANYHFNETSENWAVLGSSSSAVGAFSLAWYKPACFQRVIALSPSFVSLQVKRTSGWVNADEFAGLVKQAKRSDLSVYLSTGLKDLKDSDGPGDKVLTWSEVNTELALALHQQGHRWRYFFRTDHGHNSDYAKPQVDEILKWAWQDVPLSLPKNKVLSCQ